MATEEMDFIKNLDALHGFLKGKRSDAEADWEILLPEFRPEIGDLLHKGRDSVQYNSNLFSGYGSQALTTWARGIVGGMFYPKPRWLSIAIDNRELQQDSQIKDYTQEWSEELFHAFNRSNFYSAMSEMAPDAGAAIGYLVPMEDEKRQRMHFQHDHLGDVWIARDALGYLERVHREVRYSASAAAKEFGEDKLSNQVQQYLKDGNNKFTNITFIHCIFPNPDYDPRRPEPVAADLLPYLSVYYEKSTKHMVMKTGSRFLPIAWGVHRYARQWYPYSPAQCALVDVLTDNAMTKDLVMTSQMSAQPPKLVPASLRGQVMNIPNGFTYYKNAQVMQGVKDLHERGLNWVVPNEERELIRQSIDRWMSKDLFSMMGAIMQKTGETPTAFQISRAEAEKSILLGPQLGSLIEDVGNPSVDIMIDYVERTGTPPEMPAILEDYLMEQAEQTGVARIDTLNEFTGILNQTQSKVIQQQSIIDALSISAMILEQYPDAQYVLKPYELMRGAMDSTNLDQDTINDKDSYQEIVTQIREDQEIAQQAELNKAAAESYQKMTGAPEEGSPVAA